MTYIELSPVIDTALMVALCGIVWIAYRQLRAAKHRSAPREKVLG